METDRRARRLAIARRRPRPVRQGSDEWFRCLAKAFRRMEMYQIARRRERIAAQPRVGDVVVTREGRRLVVAEVRDWGVWWFTGDDWRSPVRPLGYDRQYWREAVRRAQMTQEGSEA